MTSNDQMKASTRLASIVIVVAMLSWMAISWLGGAIGLPERYAFLADLAALAAFAFAFINAQPISHPAGRKPVRKYGCDHDRKTQGYQCFRTFQTMIYQT